MSQRLAECVPPEKRKNETLRIKWCINGAKEYGTQWQRGEWEEEN